MSVNYNDYTMVRNGLREHMDDGRIDPFDVGIYLRMHMDRNWSTGIYKGSAEKLVQSFGGRQKLKRKVQRALFRLRKNKFINYATKVGTKGNYSILLHKVDITAGALTGQRLNAFAPNSLECPVYEDVSEECRDSVAVVSQLCRDSVAVVSQECRGSVVVVSSIQEVQDVPEVLNGQNGLNDQPIQSTSGAVESVSESELPAVQEQEKNPAPASSPKPKSEADRAASYFWLLLDKPKAYANSAADWSKRMAPLMRELGMGLDEFKLFLKWVVVDNLDPENEKNSSAIWILKAKDPLASLIKNAEWLAKYWSAVQKVAKAKAAPAANQPETEQQKRLREEREYRARLRAMKEQEEGQA